MVGKEPLQTGGALATDNQSYPYLVSFALWRACSCSATGTSPVGCNPEHRLPRCGPPAWGCSVAYRQRTAKRCGSCSESEELAHLLLQDRQIKRLSNQVAE